MVKALKISCRKGIPFSFFAAFSPSPSLLFLHSLLISHHVSFIYISFLFIQSLSHSLTPMLNVNLTPRSFTHYLPPFDSRFSQLLVPDSLWSFTYPPGWLDRVATGAFWLLSAFLIRQSSFGYRTSSEFRLGLARLWREVPPPFYKSSNSLAACLAGLHGPLTSKGSGSDENRE